VVEELPSGNFELRLMQKNSLIMRNSKSKKRAQRAK